MALGKFNWLGKIQCFEGQAQKPRNEKDLIDILKNRDGLYPSPVRPMGSRHSMTACMQAYRSNKWGTGVDMTDFTELSGKRGRFSVDLTKEPAEVTIAAGLTFVEVARELRDQHHLTFNVITEIGTLTVGASACGATKDSSGVGEFGQVCSDVVAMRLIQPNGVPRDARRGVDADFEALCCSYGLFGIATEVTFRVVPHKNVRLHHEEIPLENFDERTQKLLDAGNALFLYMFPYEDPPRIIAEVRRTAADQESKGEWRLCLRNFFWRVGLHIAVRIPLLRTFVPRLVCWFLLRIMHPDAASPVSQIVDYRRCSPRFTFSMWAFPKDPKFAKLPFSKILAEYFAFCRSDEAAGFRNYLPHVSYHIGCDRSSLLSYSYNSDVWTIDPIVGLRDRGWREFLRAFNRRCIGWGGTPLFNQTPELDRGLVKAAFRERLDRFEELRSKVPNAKRMLNDYFAKLLGIDPE